MKGNLNSFDFSVECAGRLNYFPRIAVNFINNLNTFACIYTGYVQPTHDESVVPYRPAVCAANALIRVLKLYEIMFQMILEKASLVRAWVITFAK